MEDIRKQAEQAALELCALARLQKGQILIVGCSSSEMLGERIGSHSSLEAAEAALEGVQTVLQAKGIYLAAQCCEHLNRAIVIEREAVPGAEPVNVVPQPKADGSFATAAYESFRDPVVLEAIRADAGLDIGDTLIGMHLKPVAVPVRLRIREIGHAHVTAARTRPKFIGGERAVYDEKLK